MAIDAAFEEIHTLADGVVVRLRLIRPDDADELRSAFARLSPTSRFRRFAGSFDHLDDATVRYLTHIDGVNHVAIVAYTDSPDLKTEMGVGVARFIRLPDEPTVAEAAVVVVDDYQGRGVATLLSGLLARAARERGIERFRAEVLLSNEPVRQLLRDVHAIVVRSDDQSIVFEIPTTPADDAEAPEGWWQNTVRRLLAAAARQMNGLFRVFSTSTREAETPDRDTSVNESK